MSHPPVHPKATEVDVMLLLEGTFPYVSGGVSSWVNQIIRGFPEYRFGAVFIGSQESDYGEMKYALPDNFVHLECHYLHSKHAVPLAADMHKLTGKKGALASMQHTHDVLRDKKGANVTELFEVMQSITQEMGPGGLMGNEEFLYGRQSWDYITQQYRERCTDPSFVDYFWTVRIMHAPIWTLYKITQNLIPAKAFHSISTGYAGYLGAMLKAKYKKPLILSEHGIYTKERKIDLFQSEWIADNRGVFEKDTSQLSYFRDLWIRFFESLGRMCYAASDDIIALYEVNRLRQVKDGAPAERTANIPNGINLPRLAALRDKRPADPPPVLCLIGRVVPIKDIKTFIRAMRSVVNQLPDAEGWIAGPEDEDPAYARECHAIVEGLGLTNNVKFLGFQKIDELMPKIGLVILSSISEALPLVLLEGFAAGVPAVATDVGSCRQLMFGLDDEDKALGAAGDVVRIADPQALAQACVDLLGDRARWTQAQAAGIARVEKYYTQDMMFGKYRDLYQKAMAPTNTLSENGDTNNSDLTTSTNNSNAAPLRCPITGHQA
ncbi:GT4 family glycosyltransferase PelF [Ampullimonas aquatilis]|uniref:GT4 family glycosyltransferase PelF n=1 Tax=Ampullimonas aquatilis TaxID=1341549 RepID=UPI003C75E865